MTTTHPAAPGPEPATTSEPGPAAVAASPHESRRERLLRHRHRARLYTTAGLLVALFAVLVVLTTRNTGTVKLDWTFGSTHASLVWVILTAALLGWLLGITTAEAFHHRTRRPR